MFDCVLSDEEKMSKLNANFGNTFEERIKNNQALIKKIIRGTPPQIKLNERKKLKGKKSKE